MPIIHEQSNSCSFLLLASTCSATPTFHPKKILLATEWATGLCNENEGNEGSQFPKEEDKLKNEKLIMKVAIAIYTFQKKMIN